MAIHLVWKKIWNLNETGKPIYFLFNKVLYLRWSRTKSDWPEWVRSTEFLISHLSNFAPSFQMLSIGSSHLHRCFQCCLSSLPYLFSGGGFLGFDRAYAEVNIWIPKIIFSVTPQGLPWGAIGFWTHVSSLSQVRWEMPKLSLSTQTLKFFLIVEKTDCCVFWLLPSIR